MNVCKNMGKLDRSVRALVGVSALVLAFAMLGASEAAEGGLIAALAGVVLLVTALVGYCPAYVPLNVSTCTAASNVGNAELDSGSSRSGLHGGELGGR